MQGDQEIRREERTHHRGLQGVRPGRKGKNPGTGKFPELRTRNFHRASPKGRSFPLRRQTGGFGGWGSNVAHWALASQAPRTSGSSSGSAQGRDSCELSP